MIDGSPIAWRLSIFLIRPPSRFSIRSSMIAARRRRDRSRRVSAVASMNRQPCRRRAWRICRTICVTSACCLRCARCRIWRHDLALELITNISSHEAIRLRSDILWAAKRWREAGEQIELLYGERWREFAPLNDIERADILRASIGYALGEETIGLARLREKYGAKFRRPDRRAFEICGAAIGTSGAEPQTSPRGRKRGAIKYAFLRRSAHALSGVLSAISPGGRGRQCARARSTADKSAGDHRSMQRRPRAVTHKRPRVRDAGSSPLPPKAPRRTGQCGHRHHRLYSAIAKDGRASAIAGICWRLSAVTLDQRARDQAPAVDQDEEDQLERQ